MATENKGKCISLKAGSAIGTAFTFVKIGATSGACIPATGLTDRTLGIAQNTASSGDPVEVCLEGLSKLVCGGSVALGAVVGSDAAALGTAITVAAGGTVYNYAGGLVTTNNTAANGFAEVIVFGGGLPYLV